MCHSFQDDLVKRLYKVDAKRKLISWDRENYVFPKVARMRSIIGHRIDYNGIGVLRG